jgi:hypothetical protein
MPEPAWSCQSQAVDGSFPKLGGEHCRHLTTTHLLSFAITHLEHGLALAHIDGIHCQSLLTTR